VLDINWREVKRVSEFKGGQTLSVPDVMLLPNSQLSELRAVPLPSPQWLARLGREGADTTVWARAGDAGGVDGFVRAGSRGHRLRLRGGCQPAGSAVRRLHHAHDHIALRRPPGHDLRRCGCHGTPQCPLPSRLCSCIWSRFTPFSWSCFTKQPHELCTPPKPHQCTAPRFVFRVRETMRETEDGRFDSRARTAAAGVRRRRCA